MSNAWRTCVVRLESLVEAGACAANAATKGGKYSARQIQSRSPHWYRLNRIVAAWEKRDLIAHFGSTALNENLGNRILL
jgi:hypothetical protein